MAAESGRETVYKRFAGHCAVVRSVLVGRARHFCSRGVRNEKRGYLVPCRCVWLTVDF
nr:MAG TPA: hypothetical protein [Caudoviricetes sp.]